MLRRSAMPLGSQICRNRHKAWPWPPPCFSLPPRPILPSDCKGAKPVSTYVHTKLSNNPAFDIIRPAKGNSLDVVQLSKSSVLIMRDDDGDASCVLLLEKIVRR